MNTPPPPVRSAWPVARVLAPLLVAAPLLTGCADLGLSSGSGSHPIPVAETIRMGNATLAGGDPVTAIALFERALQGQPDNYDAQLGLAAAQLRADRSDTAQLSYDKAAALRPDAVEPPLALGRIALRQRRLTEAETRYTQAKALAAPDDTRPLVGLGATFDLAGKRAEAQRCYRQALAIRPDDDASNNLALSLALGGNPREAVGILIDIVQKPGAPPQTRHNLALAYGLMGNMAAAENVLAGSLPPEAIRNDLRYYTQLRAGLADPHPAVASRAAAEAPAGKAP